jgi:hypothetical protein
MRRFLTAEDRKRQWMDDAEARKIFAYAKATAGGHPILPCYTVSDVRPHHCRSCDKRGRFPPDIRSTAEKYARKARSRKLVPSGFQVPTREHSFTGLRVTEQSGASARSGLLPV